MITHYDMASGEILYEENAIESSCSDTKSRAPEAVLRLLTVAEAEAACSENTSHRISMPADLASISVNKFIAGQ